MPRSPDGEEVPLQKYFADRQIACRAYLKDLFPDQSEAFLNDVWERARQLDLAVGRWAEKEHGYPSAANDDPPHPWLACPGFSREVYGYIYNLIMMALR